MAYLASFESAQRSANTANQSRLNVALDLLKRNIAMYSPGGSFGAGMEAQLSSAKKESVAGGMQGLIKAGMYNTTIGSGLGTRFEKDVGGPMRLQTEDTRMQHLGGARSEYASTLGSVQTRGPDPALYANLQAQASQADSSSAMMSKMMEAMQSSQQYTPPNQSASMESLMRSLLASQNRPSGSGSSKYTAPYYNPITSPNSPNMMGGYTPSQHSTPIGNQPLYGSYA